MIYLLNLTIFRGYVGLPEGIYNPKIERKGTPINKIFERCIIIYNGRFNWRE
jgi:hypothetical protein